MVNQLAGKMLQTTPLKMRRYFIRRRTFLRLRYAIDPTKIHSELGWFPETMFKDGIKKTIQWYLDNKEWWEEIISGDYQKYYEEMYVKKGRV